MRDRQRPAPRQAGLALLGVLLALVWVTALIALAAVVQERGGWSMTLALRQARAEAAAQAGLEWARWTLRPPSAPAASPNLPPCWPDPVRVSLPEPWAEFVVTVACQRTPAASAAVPDIEEGTRRRAFYTLEARAEGAGGDAAERVVRVLTARLERCVDSAGGGGC